MDEEDYLSLQRVAVECSKENFRVSLRFALKDALALDPKGAWGWLKLAWVWASIYIKARHNIRMMED